MTLHAELLGILAANIMRKRVQYQSYSQTRINAKIHRHKSNLFNGKGKEIGFMRKENSVHAGKLEGGAIVKSLPKRALSLTFSAVLIIGLMPSLS